MINSENYWIVIRNDQPKKIRRQDLLMLVFILRSLIIIDSTYNRWNKKDSQPRKDKTPTWIQSAVMKCNQSSPASQKMTALICLSPHWPEGMPLTKTICPSDQTTHKKWSTSYNKIYWYTPLSIKLDIYYISFEFSFSKQQ